jgi:hypothetical protein
MRVLLKLVLDCTPDAAWRAVRSPAVFRAVSAPFTSFTSLEPNGFPDEWSEGVHPVMARAFGVLPLGEQTIELEFSQRKGVRFVRDTGHGVSGALTAVRRWDHTMAISAGPDGMTLYRDQLIFEAGLATPVLWLVYWAFWQWRGLALARLAPTWSAE